MEKKKRKKYKYLTRAEAEALWRMHIDFERKWDDEPRYGWVSGVWTFPEHEGERFYTSDAIKFRIEVE